MITRLHDEKMQIMSLLQKSNMRLKLPQWIIASILCCHPEIMLECIIQTFNFRILALRPFSKYIDTHFVPK